jgi:hypothetical protein
MNDIIKMICIDNTWTLFGKKINMSSLLEVGKIYEGCIKGDEFTIKRDEFSYMFGYPLNKFISLSQFREDRINQILED